MWLQTHGTAMGTCMAPSYANIFMGALEKKLLDAWPDQPRIWLRYIDDIFLIWTHGLTKLNEFIAHANTFHPTIRFTNTTSTTHIPFLDVMITLQEGTLHTDLYSKPTDTFNYLHWSSCHPQHTKRSIPYSLAFRLVRICSTEEALTLRLEQLTSHLTSRGYPKQQIQSAITKAKQTQRDTALQRTNTDNTQTERIPFVVTFNPALPHIPSIIKKFFSDPPHI